MISIYQEQYKYGVKMGLEYIKKVSKSVPAIKYPNGCSPNQGAYNALLHQAFEYLTTGAITDVLDMNETKEGIKPISNQRAGFEAAKGYR